MDLLAVKAHGIERAVVPCPPLAAIARARLANVDLLAGSGFEPAVDHDRLAIDARAIKNELTEASIVARGGLHATPALLVAGAVEHPRRIPFHAIARPDLFRSVGGQVLLGCKSNHYADQSGISGVVVPLLAGHRVACEFPHVADRCVHT